MTAWSVTHGNNKEKPVHRMYKISRNGQTMEKAYIVYIGNDKYICHFL